MTSSLTQPIKAKAQKINELLELSEEVGKGVDDMNRKVRKLKEKLYLLSSFCYLIIMGLAYISAFSNFFDSYPKVFEIMVSLFVFSIAIACFVGIYNSVRSINALKGSIKVEKMVLEELLVTLHEYAEWTTISGTMNDIDSVIFRIRLKRLKLAY